MARLLALDIGNRRTGVAFADEKAGFVMALDTIHHKTPEELFTSIGALITTRGIAELIIGLPRLPQGEEGSQAEKIRGLVTEMKKRFSIKITLMDERYTSFTQQKGIDSDAQAACSLLSVLLDQRKMGE